MKENVRQTEINQSVPDGYAILDSATGDLNKDSLVDLIVLHRNINEEETSDITTNLRTVWDLD